MKGMIFAGYRALAVIMLALAFSGAALALSKNEPAPGFTLKSNSGDNVKLSELRGQVVMVNFWASWCGPCRQEMPLLDALHQRYKSLGFTVLGVNVEEDPAAARDLLDEVPVSFPILFDSSNRVSEAYEVDAMPSTVILDRDGNVRYIHKGYVPGDENKYQEVVRALIRE
ncbi:TlpA family protein disulfide reductase [Ectothiorhodospiraceae bacterium WFHF3C12]|nr:TlpA family protein disulfide reductase [Ectothiorhodospiraceae bacterium WFHF3C12]